MKVATALIALGLTMSVPAKAGMFDGPGKLLEMMNVYVGRPVKELVDVVGSPNDQKEVLDDIILSGGFDSEGGPSCTWKVTIDKNRIVKNVSIFGNPWGCKMIVNDMKKAMKAQSAANTQQRAVSSE